MATSEIVLSAVGDVMLGELPACSGFGVGSMIERYGPEFPFAKIGAAFAGSDIVFGNLEVVLSRFDRARDPFGSIHLRAQPETLAGLRKAGFNVMALANNHIMQHGRAAVEETLKSLKEAQIAATGIEAADIDVENLAVTTVKGGRVGFLAYNFRPPQYFVDPPIDVAGSEERVLSDLERYRGSADFLVLALHWGEEFVNRPSGEQVRLGRKLIDAGASAILGHHPHILQGIETYRGRVIAYSLGDFVFDLWQQRLRESMVLRLTLHEPTRVTYEVRPICINRSWQPELLEGSAAAALQARIAGLSGWIDADLPAAEYDELVKSELRRFRREVYLHYIRNARRFGVKRFWANLQGIVGRRLRRVAESH